MSIKPHNLVSTLEGTEMDSRQQQRMKNMSEEEAERFEFLSRRLKNPDEKKMFRNAYCFKSGYDFSTLKPYCENLVLAYDGYSDHIDIVRKKLEDELAGYDSDKDLIVLAGRVIDHLLVGQIITQKILLKPKAYQSYAIAVYFNYRYIFYQIYLDPEIHAEEMLTK